MTGLLRAETRKLTAMLLVTVGGLMLMFAVALAAVEQNWANSQMHVLDQTTGTATCTPNMDTETCQRVRDLKGEADRRFAEKMWRSIRPIAAQQTPAGAFSFVAGLMMTSAGAAVAFLLAAVVVGGEWQRGTATPMFLAERRLYRIAIAKIVVISGVCMLVTLMAWAAVFVFGLLYEPMASHAGTTDAGAAKAIWRLALLVGVTLLWSIIAVLIGMTMRSRLGTLVLGGLLLGALNIAASIGGLEAYTPFGLLADVVPFNEAYAAWDYVMARPEEALQTGGGPVAPEAAIGDRLIVMAPVLIVLMAGTMWLRRMDLIE